MDLVDLDSALAEPSSQTGRTGSANGAKKMTKETTMTTEILTCNVGKHEWERPVKRGVKPKSCPEHTISKSPAKDPHRAMQDGRARKSRESREAAIAEILEHPRATACDCEIALDVTDTQLIKMEGCKSPSYVCGTLDLVRRAVSKKENHG